MTRVAIIMTAFSVALVLATSGAIAQEAMPEQAAPSPEPLSALSTDDVLDRLAASPNKAAGAPLEAEALRRFHQSGSATIDMMLGWATKAMQDERYPVALDILDRIILLEPDFAEGWNKRATVHFLIQDYGKSLSDIRQTLARQPRHFGAMAGLGLILRDIGEPQEALEAFRSALAVNPHLENASKVAEELEGQVGGDSI